MTSTPIKNYVVSEGLLPMPWFILEDAWERFNETGVQKYLKRGYKIFLRRLEKFRNLKRKLSVKEEKELRFMFESLISAKKLLQD